jgi:hypothetical protein
VPVGQAAAQTDSRDAAVRLPRIPAFRENYQLGLEVGLIGELVEERDREDCGKRQDRCSEENVQGGTPNSDSCASLGWRVGDVFAMRYCKEDAKAQGIAH